MPFINEEDFLFSYSALNRYSTTLASGITDTDDVISLTTVGNLANSIKGVISIGNEHIFYEGINGSNLTGCVRGFENTTATAHSAGEVVQQRVDAYIFNKMIESIRDIPKIDMSNAVTAELSGDSFTPSRGNLVVKLSGEGSVNDDVLNIGAGNVNDGESIVIYAMNQLNFKNTGNLVVDNISLTDIILPQYSIMAFYWHNDTTKWRVLFSSLGVVNTSITASNKLELPTDGDFTDGAIQNWSIGVTTYSDAIDDINEALASLLPPKPPSLSAFSLSITGYNDTRGGINLLLASGTTDNTTGGAPSAGTQVKRVTNTSVTSTTISEFGAGTTGTLIALVNNANQGQKILTSADDSGTYSSLVILADQGYPTSNPNFWQSLTARMIHSVSVGINKFKLSHSIDGDTNETFFVYDNVSNTPAISAISIAEGTAGTLVYSSGIPHYNTGATLSVSATITNLASACYLASNNVEISSTTGFGSQINLAPGSGGLPNPFTNGMGSQNIVTVFTISDSDHTFGQIQARGRNAANDGSLSSAATIVNVMAGTVTPDTFGPIQELGIYVKESLGSIPAGADTLGKRIQLTNSDTPNDDKSAYTVTDWVSSASVAAHEAKVIGGLLRHSSIDYTAGYLPAGLNYSAHNANQYFTVFFRRSAVSQFKISVSGTYDACWVKMFGITGIPNAVNGWFDMFKLYDGAGVPGGTGNTDGCAFGTAMAGSSGLFTCTFGTESSTNSTNNIIMVRFKLTAGKQITQLHIKD